MTPPRTRDIGGPASRSPSRLHVDWTACDGRGLCAELLPELLDRDEWGYPVARDRSREPSVPSHLRPHAERAVASCPLQALSLLGG
jgi:ferredoxin